MLKHTREVISKECRYEVTVDLTSFFLKNEYDGEEKLMFKFIITMALFMIKYDESPYQKHLKRENGNHVVRAKRDKATCSGLIISLLARKKLVEML